MQQNLGIQILKNQYEDSEYVIKDKDKINIGRFNIEELDEANKRCNIKLKFYRGRDEALLRETLDLMLKALFKDTNINKININIGEEIPLTPFLNNGFVLEGIFNENVYYKGEYYSELSLGINRMDYSEGTRINLVSIKGERVELKLLTPENASELLNYYNDNKEHLSPFEPTRDNSFYTLASQKQILWEGYRMFLNGSSIDFGLYLNNRLIGKLKISNIVQGIFKNGILGYSMDKDYQGYGYMKEGVNLALHYAFNDMDLHRIEASALMNNEKSINVLEGCGFKRLGVNEDYLYINGGWQNHITYYKIKR